MSSHDDEHADRPNDQEYVGYYNGDGRYDNSYHLPFDTSRSPSLGELACKVVAAPFKAVSEIFRFF